MLLALETANDGCSVALYDGRQVVAQHQDDRSREQTRLILPMIDAVLHEQQLNIAELKAIAFSRGPGSFSGVRINAAVAQALAWAHDLPVVPVSTLQALAQAAYRLHGLTHVMSVLDARMNEVYSAAYQLDDQGLMQPLTDEQLGAYDQLDLADQALDFALVGNGSVLVSQSEAHQTFPQLKPTSEDIAVLAYATFKAGQAVSAAQALPVYLRDNAWKKIAEQGSSKH
ncbi:tRNA (adenosine(37)-N6)-threonylcarbamoyltransferase complex dimerization subunit type 1 TsaB [Alkanindiges sp. WGS2144]|uniref:tRNA (adenosine(37)-N6)-threonylcarbamoyltransferase complex dimerization subunit type 1 TsaB n=1 Tax=Alkanindiges sp. WGS2144 TaxID=3366808 RepID=UPI003753C9AD